MKHYALLLIGLLSVIGLVSCEFETLDNGRLDGYWQMARIDTLRGGGRDVVKARLFWSVQGNLLQTSDLTYRLPTCLFRFARVGDEELRVYDPHVLDRQQGDRPITDTTLLCPYGIQQLEERFIIERLDHDHLQLCGPTLRLTFNRY